MASWSPVIALDTEFIRANTFYPIPGLYQVASGADVFLLDPLTIENWEPFMRYLVDADTRIIMHACLEDLELIRAHLQVVRVMYSIPNWQMPMSVRITASVKSVWWSDVLAYYLINSRPASGCNAHSLTINCVMQWMMLCIWLPLVRCWSSNCAICSAGMVSGRHAATLRL